MVDINITVSASEPLLGVLGRIAEGLLRLASPLVPATTLPVQTEPAGVLQATVAISSHGSAEGPSRAADLTPPAAGSSRIAAGALSAATRPDWLTDDRFDCLKQLSARRARYVRPSLQRFPGPPLPGVPAIMRTAASLGFPLGQPDWLTDAREARLKALYPAAPRFQDVWDGVRDASPDVPMPNERQVLRNAALNMGLRRPQDLMPPGLKRHVDARVAAADTPGVIAPPLQPPAAPRAEGAPATLGDAVDEKLRSKLMRLAEPAPALPPVPKQTAPIEAGQEAIRVWAQQRGLQMGAFDIDVVNRKAKSLGHPGFILRSPAARRSA